VEETVLGLERDRVQPRSRARYIATALTATSLAAGVAIAAGVGGPAGASVPDRATPKVATVPLVVYSAQGYDHVETAAFSKKYHIKVSLDDN
jgi:hypothetical protein